MSPERSRQLGQALMALAVVQLLVFFLGAMRRSYLVLALPVAAGLAVVSGLAYWVGYTLAHARWDEDTEVD